MFTQRLEFARGGGGGGGGDKEGYWTDSPVVWEGEVRSMQWFRSSYRMGFIRIESETTPSPIISRPKRH